jgi:hypothetical protein
VFAVFFLSFSGAGLVHFLGEMVSGERSPDTIEIVAPAVLVLVGSGLVMHYFTTVVILFPDAIELRTLWSTKRLAFSEIRGRHEYETTDSDGIKTQYIKLESVDHHRPTLEFQRFYNFDSAFDEWLKRLPNLPR